MSDLLHHARPVVRRVHATRSLVPIERAHHRAVDIAPGESAVQTSCATYEVITFSDGQRNAAPIPE